MTTVATVPTLERAAPPVVDRQAFDWHAHLKPLMAHPGEWFKVARTSKLANARTIAHRLRREPSRVPTGRWEFTSRPDDSGGGVVFARYLGAATS